MTVRLPDTDIEELEWDGKVIRCVAAVCRVCGFRQHVSPNEFSLLHPHLRERCPNGCKLDGEVLTTHIAETHWHAADGTGPVSQYAATR